MNWLKQTNLPKRWQLLSCLASGSLILASTACNSLGEQASYETQAAGEEAAGYAYEGEEQYQYKKAQLKRHPDIGKTAIPSPPGTYVNPWYDAQICSARAYDYVISRHEWFAGGRELGPDGKLHVRKLADGLLSCPEQVILEAEPVIFEGTEALNVAEQRTDELNEHRRQVVIAGLQEHGVSDAADRVFVAPLDRVGVHGIEAPRIYNQLIWGGGGGGQRGGQRGGGGFGGGGGGFGGGFGGGGGGIY